MGLLFGAAVLGMRLVRLGSGVQDRLGLAEAGALFAHIAGASFQNLLVARKPAVAGPDMCAGGKG